MKCSTTLARSVVLLALCAALAGCGSDNAVAPQFEPEVVNLQDSFSFQTTGISDVTQVLTYSWENTGVSANVDQSCSVSKGSAVLEILDAQGTTVYTQALSSDGSFQTTDGNAGTWTIRVMLSGASGTLNFSLQKRTV
jgi:hypothetical protein